MKDALIGPRTLFEGRLIWTSLFIWKTLYLDLAANLEDALLGPRTLFEGRLIWTSLLIWNMPYLDLAPYFEYLHLVSYLEEAVFF